MRASIHFAIDIVVPAILEIGMKRVPNEACGIVVPDLDVPADEWVIELVNRSDQPLTSYVIDPVTIDGLLKDPEHWDDVLIWHTHPSGRVGPSQMDMSSRIEGLRYLVVSLPRGEAVLF